jgi:DNA-binding protein H-NS
MARTFAQIQKQIDALQREAEKVRTREVQGVIGRIKEAITVYGLTPEDLFRASKSSGKTAGKPGRKLRAVTAEKTVSPAKFRDPATGKTWTGNGKRPGWFVDALASGKKAEELAI